MLNLFLFSVASEPPVVQHWWSTSIHEAFHFCRDLQVFFAKWQKALFYKLIPIVGHVLSSICPWPLLEPTISILMWRKNGVELVPASRPLGAQLGAERTLIPAHPHQIHFLALGAARHRGPIISSQGKLPIIYATEQDETWCMLAHTMSAVCLFFAAPHFPPLTSAHFLSLSITLAQVAP